jgi:hypothetical protein
MERWKMSRYRIVPFGSEGWAVEEKLFGFLPIWSYVQRQIGEGVYSPIEHASEKAAEEWIEHRIRYGAETRGLHASAYKRKVDIRPREYP